MAHYFITGIAGFIGSHTADLLVDLGHTVSGIDNFSTGRRENVHPKATCIEGDILDLDALTAAMRDVEYVIHLAARPSVPRSLHDPTSTNRINVEGTINVLQEARRCGAARVVVASSSSVYGEVPTLPKSEDLHCQPRSPYAVSKLATEQYALAFYKSFGLETVALRYFNVYGPRQRADTGYAAVIPAFIAAALHDEPAVIEGTGEQTRDFTFVEDVAEQNHAACHSARAVGQAINICNGVETSISTLHQLIALKTGHTVAPMYRAARAGDVMRSYGATTRRRITLRPLNNSIAISEGLDLTIKAVQNS